MDGKRVRVKFAQITADADELYGLDDAGKVWKYIPAQDVREWGDKAHFATWVRLTDYGVDNTGPRETT